MVAATGTDTVSIMEALAEQVRRTCRITQEIAQEVAERDRDPSSLLPAWTAETRQRVAR